MVEANKKKVTKYSGPVRVSTVDCSTEKSLVAEVIQDNRWKHIENRNHPADLYFLHPMAEAANYKTILENKGIYNKLAGVRAAKNKRRCA